MRSPVWRDAKRVHRTRATRRIRRLLSGRTLHGVILAACLAIIAVTLWLGVERLAAERLGWRWGVYCLLNDWFGLECTSGGLVRSLEALAQVDVRGALAYHPIGPLFFGVVVFQVPYRVWALAAWPRALPRFVRQVHGVLVGGLCVAIIIDWLLLAGSRMV